MPGTDPRNAYGYGYGANVLVLRQIYAIGQFVGMNCFSPLISGAYWEPVSLAAIVNPSGTMLIGERGTFADPYLTCPNSGFAVGYDPGNPVFQPGGADFSLTLLATYGSSPDYRHNGFGNFLFCDGHVKAFYMCIDGIPEYCGDQRLQFHATDVRRGVTPIERRQIQASLSAPYLRLRGLFAATPLQGRLRIAIDVP